MNKCIIIPDSFKGTLTSQEFCDIATAKIAELFPSCAVHTVPVADGGEGTVDCFISLLHCQRVELTVAGPFGEPVTACYARDGQLAIVEVAASAGLPQVEGRADPLRTTTLGVGQMILHAVQQGCTKVILGLGGSCTNDGGAGMAVALGTVFCDADGKAFTPTGGTLCDIVSIDNTATTKLLQGVTVLAMCDITNPLYGDNGAAAIFAPQKGADERAVALLDEGLRQLDTAMQQSLRCSVAHEAGAGAAGGMGAGVLGLLGGRLQSGIDTVLDLAGFDQLLQGADLVLTGEGRIDGQSLGGKAIVGIAKRAAAQAVPVVAVVGSIADDAGAAYEHGVSAIFSINRTAEAFETARYKTAHNLAATLEDILRLWGARG